MNIEFRGKVFEWNPIDKKLLQVNDWIDDLNTALSFVPEDRRGIAIQAGGACGMWPLELSYHFNKVYTFEPDEGNYDCLTENLKGRDNVEHYLAALGLLEGFVRVELPPSEQNNAGAYYTMPAKVGDSSVPQFNIDTFMGHRAVPDRVDFIQLDVEGREMCVLGGGVDMIDRDKPVIMLEDKPLPQDKHTGHVFGQVEKWLTGSMGYRVAKRVHRDIIFVPRGR